MEMKKKNLNPSRSPLLSPRVGSRTRSMLESERSKSNVENSESTENMCLSVIVVEPVEEVGFFQEALVWPDPEGVFRQYSRTTPEDFLVASSMSAVCGKSRVVESRCEAALKVVKYPRPTEIPWNVLVVHSDPPTVDIDDVEEFLVHDPLFVEFFNAFLALPSFPEPLCFNVATGGFEVVSDGKQKLARQIKEAVRSQQLTARMYRLARKHAFSDIPTIPIEEDVSGPEEVKIDTSYQVTTLNKEQGIYWIRAERLPIFLESDFYFTYRLAKVISQAKLFNENNEYVIMKLDFTPRPKKVKKQVEEPPPNPEEIIAKQMFLNFGNVQDAAKEEYFAQAKERLNPQSGYAPLFKEDKLDNDDTNLKLQDGRPKSSVFQSKYFGVYSPGLAGPEESDQATLSGDMVLSERIFTPCQKPVTPRPTEKVHVATEKLRKTIANEAGGEEELVKPGVVVKVYPKQDVQSADDESGIGDMDDKDDEWDKKLKMAPIIDQIYNDGSWEKEGELIVLPSKTDLASVIVGAVMKKALSDMLNVPERVIVTDPVISSLYPSKSLTCVSVDSIDICVVDKDKKQKTNSKIQQQSSAAVVKNSSGVKSSSGVSSASVSKDKGPESETTAEGYNTSSFSLKEFKQAVNVKWDKPVYKPAEEESDADSLLDSDEDFEDRDVYFRRNKNKWHSLTSIKGIMDFKKFLEGTSGEKYWDLWIDIDKGRLLTDPEEKQEFIMNLRNRYFKHGSYFELSTEDKKKLGLENTSSWTPEYLLQVQPRVLEPLILYWAPRYLLKHLVRSHPEQYPTYRQLMSVSRGVEQADPHPHTQSLLPLGPKSCCPRRSGQSGADQPKSIYKCNEAEFLTTPKVGNRRVYGTDTLKRLAQTPTAKFLGIQPNPPPNKEDGVSPNVADEKKTKTTTAVRPGSSESGKSERKQNLTVKSVASSSGIETLRSASRHSGNSSPRMFVGKLPGMESKRGAASSRHSTTSVDKDSQPSRPTSSSLSARTTRKNCLTRPLTAGLLGDSSSERVAPKPQLGPVKKPKDLLSPMLRIIDTKNGKNRRVMTAPPSRSSDRLDTRTTFYRQDSQESSKSCDKPRSAPGVPGDAVGPDTLEFTDITDCDFIGSERMEFLLQALHHEQASGKTFRKFIEKSERSDWINNLDFWEKVQNYRKLFYMDKLDLFLIAKLAKSIFATCVVDGSAKNIGVSDSVELGVMMKLNPAYEDLFDEAEEHSLKILFEAFQLYLSQDVKTYCKVERADVVRRLETKNTYILNLQKQGIIKEGPLTPDDPMEGYVEPVCDESLLEKVPEQYRDWNLDKLLHNRLELESFRQYLADNYAEMDLKCWMDIEAWRRTPPEDERKRDQRVRDIKKNYLNKKYFFGPSSPAGKEGQNKVMEVGGGWGKFLEDKPHPDSILLAQKYVRERLEKKHLPLFLLSKDFQARQSPRLSMADSAEDVMVQKKRRNQNVLKVTRETTSKDFLNILKSLESSPSKADSKVTSSLPNIKSPHQLSSGPTSNSQIKKSESEKRSESEMTSTVTLPSIHRQSMVDKHHSMTDKHDMVGKRLSMVEKRYLPHMEKYKSRKRFLLESKWVSSTKEIFLFKHALQNPITCKLFRKYVSMKGDNLENDVLFWLEVQNYKKMNHSHTEDSNLSQKISAIVHCFLDSTIPPSLQIDIPQEMAERILDHKHERSPYLFREAQLATFRILLQHWQNFCEWRNNMHSDEKALTTLERHRILSKQREAQRRAEIDEQKERERMLRQELGLGENEELPDDLFEDDDDEKQDAKITFSYAEYIASARVDDGVNDIGSCYNLNLASFDDNASQTVRGVPKYEGQPYNERPGFHPDDTVGLEERMYTYTKADTDAYFDYILDEANKRHENDKDD